MTRRHWDDLTSSERGFLTKLGQHVCPLVPEHGAESRAAAGLLKHGLAIYSGGGYALTIGGEAVLRAEVPHLRLAGDPPKGSP